MVLISCTSSTVQKNSFLYGISINVTLRLSKLSMASSPSWRQCKTSAVTRTFVLGNWIFSHIGTALISMTASLGHPRQRYIYTLNIIVGMIIGSRFYIIYVISIITFRGIINFVCSLGSIVWGVMSNLILHHYQHIESLSFVIMIKFTFFDIRDTSYINSNQC